MRGLIGDLLDVEAVTLSVAPEPSEVAALVDRARSTFLSAGGRHTVLIDLPPDLPRVMADRPRIVQVLNNLLSNAARHSPHSAPIRVAAERDGAHVAVSVRDEGRGVAPERLPHLFRKYAHAEGGGRAAAGMGLGLIICKGLVEAHGGPHPGRERRDRPGRPVCLHRPGGRGCPAGRVRRPRPAPGSHAPGAARAPPASWWSTTTRRCCATCATRSPRRATPWW